MTTKTKDYSSLSEKELLKHGTTSKTHNKEINKEWRRRYGMQFPYQLDISGAIKNQLINAFVAIESVTD